MSDTPETFFVEWTRTDGVLARSRLHAEKLERERDEARKVLNEIANASHFDNIGNWARNEAKKALEGAK